VKFSLLSSGYCRDRKEGRRERQTIYCQGFRLGEVEVALPSDFDDPMWLWPFLALKNAESQEEREEFIKFTGKMPIL